MSNVRLCYPNRAAAASYSGQGWVPTLPLSHLATRQLSQVARSHPTPAATFYAAFGAATDVGVAALAGHNLSTSGQWRLRGYSADPRPYVDRSAQVATLDLRFADGVLPAGIACTRASVATYFDAAGLLQTAAADTPRITHAHQLQRRAHGHRHRRRSQQRHAADGDGRQCHGHPCVDHLWPVQPLRAPGERQRRRRDQQQHRRRLDGHHADQHVAAL
jgi:hypothetical protein